MPPRRSLVAVVAATACFGLPATAAADGQPATAAQAPPAALDDAGRLTLDFTVDRFVTRDGRLRARGTAGHGRVGANCRQAPNV